MNTKIKITLIVLSMVAVLSANAQWTNQSTTKLPYVHASCVVNKQLCFVLSGVCIYQSKDGGITWQMDSILHLSTPIYRYEYASIQFISSNIGFVSFSTEQGTYVFKTDNAGNSWTPMPLSSNLSDHQFKMISEMNWLAYTTKGLIETNDGGNTWSEIKVNNDTIINEVEILNTDWYVLTSNGNNSINVHVTRDQGSSFTLLGSLQMEEDTMLQIAMNDFVSMAKTKRGIAILYNVYYAGCGSYYDHSRLYYLHQGRYDEWYVTDSLKRFNNIPSSMFFKNDTGYLVGSLTIYKTTDGGLTWEPVHAVKDYSWGSIASINFVDGSWWATTTMGAVLKKDEWSSDQNLKVNVFNKHAFIAYPNPANNHINFQIDETIIGAIELVIANMNGQIVSQTILQQTQYIGYNTSELANGIYTFSLKYNNQIHNGTFTINR